MTKRLEDLLIIFNARGQTKAVLMEKLAPVILELFQTQHGSSVQLTPGGATMSQQHATCDQHIEWLRLDL